MCFCKWKSSVEFRRNTWWDVSFDMQIKVSLLSLLSFFFVWLISPANKKNNQQHSNQALKLNSFEVFTTISEKIIFCNRGNMKTINRKILFVWFWNSIDVKENRAITGELQKIDKNFLSGGKNWGQINKQQSSVSAYHNTKIFITFKLIKNSSSVCIITYRRINLLTCSVADVFSLQTDKKCAEYFLLHFDFTLTNVEQRLSVKTEL